MKNSKFVPLYETIYNRFKQGSGFLEGDVVKFKKEYKSTEGFKALPESIKQMLADLDTAGYNLRVGRLHTPNNQYGSFGYLNLPATHADLYQERAPGSFGNLVTVPIELLETIDTGINLPPVSKKNKRTKNEAPYQKPTKASNNKDAVTDEQTRTAEEQTHAPKGDYDLGTKNTGGLNAKKVDDSKPSKFKPLPKNSVKPKKLVSEVVSEMQDIYTSILNEDVGMSGGGAIEEEKKN
jgi:hypothetical protein